MKSLEFAHFQERIMLLTSETEKKRIQEFLGEQDLLFDNDIEYTVALFDKEKIIATGSFCQKILKCIAVDQEYKNMGLSNRIVSHLVSEQYQRGNTHLFLYTKPENYTLFSELGFYKISEVISKVVLMENKPNGIKSYLEDISEHKHEGKDIASIVMNCNPFTLGHQYLIEYAAARNDQVNIFAVSEDKSSFPAEVRYELIKEGVKHLPNVVVHKGKDYIISSATFPSYFIKEYQDAVETHALLDLKIFGEHITPSLGIHKRYIGEEPYCHVTRTYNQIMKEVLPRYQIQVIEVPRMAVDDSAVSASIVRAYIRSNDLEKIQDLVPQTTYDFIISKEARNIIRKIQNENSRH
ncbi:MAG: [citrate (pro-3S)-lyase] ligase [Clostridia bacterium]|nr:[citrate (pro-3S)-lyase] ligase [Clostridia bacterium]